MEQYLYGEEAAPESLKKQTLFSFHGLWKKTIYYHHISHPTKPQALSSVAVFNAMKVTSRRANMQRAWVKTKQYQDGKDILADQFEETIKHPTPVKINFADF